MAKQGEHGISWTDETWNPIRGCTRISRGCTNCYAEKIAARFSGKGQTYEGLATIKNIRRDDGSTLTTLSRWTGKIDFIEHKLYEPLHWKKPRMIFVNSMSDIFHEDVPDEWIDKIFAVMALSPLHTFQVLTKRAERMRDYIGKTFEDQVMRDALIEGMAQKIYHERTGEDPSEWLAVHLPLPKVWLGVSAEDKETADERVPFLMQTSAAVRWVSYEPALGPVDFSKWLRRGLRLPMPAWSGDGVEASGPRIDWLVCGGESGADARPMHPNWARAVRDQCVEAGVAFHFKQIGEWGWGTSHPTGTPGRFAIVPEDGRDHVLEVAEYPRQFTSFGSAVLEWAGKRNAGRKLDGREWNEYPR